MPEIKLLPCPFCGGEAELRNEGYCSFVKCQSCGAEAGLSHISAEYCANEKSAEAWNRRVDNGKV